MVFIVHHRTVSFSLINISCFDVYALETKIFGPDEFLTII